MIIGRQEIKTGNRPFIVCEIGAAHNGKLDRALTLMEMAKRAGADAVKIQAYSADTITIDCDRPEFTIQAGPWLGHRLYDLYSHAAMPREWYGAMFDRAKALDIMLFASVFSPEDIRWMDQFGCPVYKIASCELVDTDLIRAVGETRRPVIISTGMGSKDEITEAIRAYYQGGGRLSDVALLHCVTDYPTPVEHMGMRVLTQMQEDFVVTPDRIPIGLSDHTIGSEAAVVATVLGAAIIEKHMTLDRADGGLDDEFASNPDEFLRMVRAVHRAHSSLETRTSTGEQVHMPLRRSLYVVQNVKAGERFTRNNVRSIRPGKGLSVQHLPDVLNAISNRDIEAGTPMSLDFVERS
jgi:N-acetylneuraminate synthase